MRIFALVLLVLSNAAFGATMKPITVQGRVDADVTDPAQTFFNASGDLVIPEGMVFVIMAPLATVPEGQRAVIEQASVVCTGPVGNPVIDARIGLTRLTGPDTFTKIPFPLPLQLQGTHPLNGPTYVGSLSTRLYSDPGLIDGGITMGAVRENGVGESSCFFTISGYNVVVDESTATPASAGSVDSAVSQEAVVIPYTSEAMLSELMNTYDSPLMMEAPSR
jgi:hypothetical protein